MTKNAISVISDITQEEAVRVLDRVDALLKIWHIPEEYLTAPATKVIRDGAAESLQSGEARALAEKIMAPIPAYDLGLQIGELIGSFPPRAGQDLQIFSKMMTLDVIAAAPSRVALMAAARALRASCTFLPSIKEVLDAVEAQKSACASRAALLERLPRRIAELDRANNSGADRE